VLTDKIKQVKQYKPWFCEEDLQLLEQKEQAKIELVVGLKAM
jgi:hypothetical protein